MSQQQEPFTVGLHKPQQLQNMRFDYAADGTAVYKPVATATPTYHPTTAVAAAIATVNINGIGTAVGVGAGSGGESSAALDQKQGQVGSYESMKRKRGRPRKYGPDGTMALALTPTSPTPVAAAAVDVKQSGGAFSPAPPSAPAAATAPAAPAAPTAPAAASAAASPNSMKKGRGRPRGSGNKHRIRALGPAGVSFIPHVLTVKAGEDLSSKIMSHSMNGPRNVCILTANGAISNVTLRQPATSGGTVTYEGRFEILTLGGSLLLPENGGQCNRYGGLNVSLSGPDGRVLGGGVAGLLIAASPVQIVLASFVEDGCKGSKLENQMENLSAPPKVGTAGQSSSPSRGTLSESSGGAGSPLNQSTGACNNNNPPQGISGMPWK